MNNENNSNLNNKPTFKEMFKSLKGNKLFLSFFIVVVLLIIVSLIYIIVKDKSNNTVGKKDVEKIDKVETSDVETIYGYLSNIDCNKNLTWDLTKDNKIMISEIESILKTKIVLSRIDKDNKLNDTLTKNIFKEYARSVLGKNEGNRLNIDSIDYNGNTYVVGKDSTTITQNTTCEESSYVSRLFGYTYNENELSVDISVGKISDDKLLNMDNEELGTFKDENEMKNLLNSSTIYRYGFYKEDNNYIIDNVTKVVTVKGPTE